MVALPPDPDTPPADRSAVPLTLRGQLEHQSVVRPDAPFLVTDDAVITWGDMHRRARAAASGLRDLGVRAGDNVVLGLDNGVEFVEVWFGLALLGAVEVPINPQLVGDRLAHIVGHAQARIAVVTAELALRLDALRSDTVRLERLVVHDPDPSATLGLPVVDLRRLPGDEAVLVPADMTERDLAAILYTSGSTGAPKGVMLPYGQHCSNGRQAEAAGDITAADRLFLCLPLHHNMAQGYAVWPALLTGASIRLVDRFRRDRFWAQVRESEATVWPFVGSLLALLLGQPESADDAVNPIRVAYGVPIPASVHRRFEARFDVRLVHGYGSTEATIPVWSDPGSPPGAAGRVVDGYDVSVQDDCGRPVPVDEIGEIAVRARQPFTMFAGYFNDPVRTAQAWRDGWFLTGDRGSFDADGRLWFRGRAGDAIRRFGEFIDAEEVENAALAHPAVVDAACFAVDDDVAGQEAALSVVVRADITTAEIHQHIRGRLPGYAVPRFIEIAESLPKTATGKVQRFALREQGVRITMDDFLTHERQKAQ